MRVTEPLYPRVSIMAEDYLGVTSTYVPSECAFSKAGSIFEKRRARLGDNAVQAICELQSFLTFNKGT
jgi:hAT family C-terminal dimerisation region